MSLPALVIAVAVYLARGTPAPAVVTAIADAARTPYEAALLTVYAAYESNYRPNAVGDAGRSCSVWQQRCYRIAGLSLEAQAKLWLWDVDHSSLASVDSSPSRAARRTSLAERALTAAIAHPRP